MSTSLTVLALICKEKRELEKVLITPSLMQGHQTIQALASSGTPVLNLRPATIRTLAEEVATIDMIRKNLNPFPDLGQSFVMEDIFRTVSEKKGSYFHALEAADGIVSALCAALLEIRLCGVTSEELSPASFVDPRKGKDLKETAARYEKYLTKENCYDYPELLKIAIKVLSKKPSIHEKLYILPSDMPFTPLEREFLDALQGDKKVLPHDKPIGLATPAGCLESVMSVPSEKIRTNSQRLRWLFEPAGSPGFLKDDSIAIFHGMGRRNEAREVFRRIITAGIKADDVEIVHTSYDNFVPLVHSIATKLGVEVTLEEGLPVSSTRPGRALAGFLSWIASDFEGVKLRRLFASGAVSFAGLDKEIKLPLAGRVLIDSRVGWGKSRYIPALNGFLESLKAKKDGASAAYSEYLSSLEKSAAFLAKILEKVLLEIPEQKADGSVAFDRLCNAAANFVARFASVREELDAQARSAIMEALNEAAGIGAREFLFRDAVSRIESVIQKLRVGQSGPVPGRVHVASYSSGARSGRRHNFLLGCEQGLFPGAALQDPILLDEERRNLHSGLALSSEKLKGDLYKMASLLASIRGNVTLSFSSFDVLEGKESFPSTIVLQAYRLLTGVHDADYSMLESALGRPCGYRIMSGQEIDSADLWIGRVATDDGMKHARQSVLKCYPHLVAGLKALEARKSGAYTEYDGVLMADSRLDPRENGEVMSATVLEKAAKCPFRFFIENVLGVYDVDELTRTPGEWLDFMAKGSVLHDIYAMVMQELKEKNEKPSVRKHLKTLHRIAYMVVDARREEIPVTSEAAFQQDRKGILKAAEFFLKMEEQRCERVEPILFEAQFGRPEPLVIKLGSKSILLKGRIDRIDKVGPNEYEVWDYKSGSSARYRGNSVFDGGRELQPGLYSIAAEHILRSGIDKKASVKKAGYLFPTEKGGGGERGRDRDDKGLKEVVVTILDMMAGGLFIYTDDPKECEYCDCKMACGEPEIRNKYANQGNAEANLLKRLREHV